MSQLVLLLLLVPLAGGLVTLFVRNAGHKFARNLALGFFLLNLFISFKLTWDYLPLLEKHSISVEEIQNANLAILTDGLKVGQNLVIPIRSATNLLAAAANKPRIEKPLIKLNKSTSSSPKELVFLLPFNITIFF